MTDPTGSDSTGSDSTGSESGNGAGEVNEPDAPQDEAAQGAEQPSPAKSRSSMPPKTWKGALLFILLPLIAVFVAAGVAFLIFDDDSDRNGDRSNRLVLDEICEDRSDEDCDDLRDFHRALRNGDEFCYRFDGQERSGREVPCEDLDLENRFDLEDRFERRDRFDLRDRFERRDRFDRDEFCEDRFGRDCYGLREYDRDDDFREGDEFCDRFDSRGRLDLEVEALRKELCEEFNGRDRFDRQDRFDLEDRFDRQDRFERR